MDKFQNKYRIPSARAPFWDYSWNAAYFITICSKNRECFFGDVLDGRMELSAIGHIANSCWYEISNHFPFLELGVHVIMPNHVHGIIIIKKPDDGRNNGGNGGWNDRRTVETQNFASLQPVSPAPPDSQQISQQPDSSNPLEIPKSKNQFGPQSKNLASVIRGFKTGVTKNARLVNPDFSWHPRYHDHIIRNQI